ncbi:GIY-YIG nuclease family protein [Streptomyces prunicolor]|uniref:GIY-YIG nuclease family protein n=1 Tax=Streptomyces prunicolor TaxID=67348 RepID=UPI00371C0E2F
MSVQTEAIDQRQAAVYRLYDSAGALLYIGSSYNPERRYRDHYPKPWWPLVARREEEWHPSKEAAYMVEMAAIAAEAPVHNEMGTPRYVPPSEKAAARRSHLAGELTVKGIMAKYGISRQSLHTYRQRPDFPAPVSRPGTGGLRWREDEVDAWFQANPPSQGKRTDLAPQDEGAAMPPTATPPNPGHAELVDAAAALLLAAITMRDLASAMSPAAFASMPDDIRGRVVRPGYQGAFDALPERVKVEARALVDADPDVVAARSL